MTKKWAKGAPDYLIHAYENHKIRNGRDLLGRVLLKNDWNQSPWPELARYVRSDGQWLRIWGVIAYSKRMSREAISSRKSRTEERNYYRLLAKRFGKLACQIENGPLDVLSYELWAKEDWAALGSPDLNEMTQMERHEAAHKILRHWPSATDFLRSFEKRALTLASDAMRTSRPDARDRGEIAQRIFVWHLGKMFRDMFGQKLLGTVAIITDMAFDRGDEAEPTTKSFVQNVLKGV